MEPLYRFLISANQRPDYCCNFSRNRECHDSSLEINCDSIPSFERSAAFTRIIANQDPKFFGCESKLSPEDPTYSKTLED